MKFLEQNQQGNKFLLHYHLIIYFLIKEIKFINYIKDILILFKTI